MASTEAIATPTPSAESTTSTPSAGATQVPSAKPAPTPSAEYTQAPSAKPAPTPSAESTQAPSAKPAPTPSAEVPKPSQADSKLQSQVEALHKELQIWKMKSSMSERHIQPHDFDLVARLVSENIDKFGGDIDKCVSDLYSKSQYLFKIPKTNDAKVVDKEKIQSDNKKLIEGAIARLSRAKIKF